MYFSVPDASFAFENAMRSNGCVRFFHAARRKPVTKIFMMFGEQPQVMTVSLTIHIRQATMHPLSA